MPSLIKISNNAKVNFNQNCFAKILPNKPFKYFQYNDTQPIVANQEIYFQKTVSIPEELFLPVYVELKGVVAENLLVNGKSVTENIPHGADGTCAFNYTFISNSQNFTIACKNINATNSILDIEISFVPTGPFYYQYVNSSF
jgi:hypothetical protein